MVADPQPSPNPPPGRLLDHTTTTAGPVHLPRTLPPPGRATAATQLWNDHHTSMERPGPSAPVRMRLELVWQRRPCLRAPSHDPQPCSLPHSHRLPYGSHLSVRAAAHLEGQRIGAFVCRSKWKQAHTRGPCSMRVIPLAHQPYVEAAHGVSSASRRPPACTSERSRRCG